MKEDAPRVVIMDSCVYFRLARTLRPLLNRPKFGPPPPYSLFIVSFLFKEYQRSPKLKSKFEWLMQPEFLADRAAKTYTPKGKNSKKVQLAQTFVTGLTPPISGRTLSEADIWAIAVVVAMSDKGFVLVTDDELMRQTAAMLAIPCWGVLDLLKELEASGNITSELTDHAVDYMRETNDLPMRADQFICQYQSFFKRNVPWEHMQ